MSKNYGNIDFGSAKKDFIEELRRAKEELSRESDGVTDVIGDNWDDGVEYSIRRIQASSIKLSGAFKNLKASIGRQMQTLNAEINGKKISAKIDFSNIDLNAKHIKERISEIVKSFKYDDVIEFDVKGSEKHFEDLISLYVKYEEKLKSLREVKNFTSNNEAIQNMKEQIVLASRMKEIFSFFSSRTDMSIPELIGGRQLNTIINSATESIERFNAVKEDTKKTKINTGDFKNIEDILRGLKETIEGIKTSLDPISEIFKNEGAAMQNMAANGTSSFNSLSEAVNALYNNLLNVEKTVDAISKKKFDVTNITQINQKSSGSSQEILSAYQEMANGLLEITKRLNDEQSKVGNQNNKLWTDAVTSFGGLYKFMTETEKYDPTKLAGSIAGSTTVSNIKNVIAQLTQYKNIFLSVVNEINKVRPNAIDTSFLASLDEFEKKISVLEQAKPIDKNLLKGTEEATKSISSTDLSSSVEQLNKIAEVLTQIKDTLDPLSKAFTTGGTLLNQMATSGALSIDTLIDKLREVVTLSAQLGTGKSVTGVTSSYLNIPKDDGQVSFNLDNANKTSQTKESSAALGEESQKFKEVASSANDAAASKNDFNAANEKVNEGTKASIEGILAEAAAMEELEGKANGTWTSPRKVGSLSGMNLPVQIVGENGQDAVRMFSEVKSRLESEFNSPVQIRFQSAPNEDGTLEATKATVSYVNQELGITISQIYDIKRNEDGVLVATQALEKAILGTAKEAKKFDAEIERALAREKIETFRKSCGAIQIDLTNVAKAAENITDDISLKRFNKELEIVGEKLKQVKTELKGENTLDTIASAEKKLINLPTQIDTFRKKLAPLLKLDGAENVSKKLDDIMTSYVKFMSANDTGVKTNAFKSIVDNLSSVKSMMDNLKMDDSISQYNKLSNEQADSYRKIVEYRNKLNSGKLGAEETKFVAERLRIEQENFIQITKELKAYEHLYDGESRAKLLAEERLKVLEKINGEQAKAADREAKQASNYGKSTYNSATKKYDSTIASFEEVDDGKYTAKMIQALDDYKNKYNELTEARQRFINDPSLANDQSAKNSFNAAAQATEDARKKLQLYIDDMRKLQQVRDNETLINGSVTTYDPNTIESSTEAIKKHADALFGGKLQITGWNAAKNEMYGNLDKGKGVIENVTVALDRGTNTLYAYSRGTKELGTMWSQLAAGITKKSKEILTYVAGGSSIYKVISEVRKGIQYVKELDSALTELKKVTNETDESYANFVKTMSSVGAEIGATVTNLTNMAASWARLGYSMKEAGDLAKSTAILLNVSEFTDADSASEALISTIQAYGYAADESMQVVDVLNEVGNNFAVSSDGLATALKTSASALMSAGNDLNQSVAMVAAANRVLQDPSQVGSALRTISLRIRGTSVKELEALGEETDGAVESVSKLQAKIEGLTGVDILTDAGAYKSTYQVLKEIAEVWPTLSDMSRAGALELLAGKNRSNAVAAILTNIEDLEGAYEAAMQAEGSAMRENEKYLNSIQGRIDKFKNAVQTMWNDELGSGAIKTFVEIGIGAVELIDKLGLLQTVILSFAAIEFGKALFKGVKFGEVAKEINTLTMGMNMFTKGTIKATLSSTGQVISNNALAISFKTLTASIWAAVKAVVSFLVTNPFGWAIMAASAIALVAVGISKAIKTHEEYVDEIKDTTNNINEMKDSITNLNKELKTTTDRIAELESKDALTFTEKEELKRLRLQNAELDRAIKLKEREKELEEKKRANSYINAAKTDNILNGTNIVYQDSNGNYVSSDEANNTFETQSHSVTRLNDGYTEKTVGTLEKKIAELEIAEKNYEQAYANYEKAQNDPGTSEKELKKLKTNLDKTKEVYDNASADITTTLATLEETYGDMEWYPDADPGSWQEESNKIYKQVFDFYDQLAIRSDTTGKAVESAFNRIAGMGQFDDNIQKIEETVGMTGESLREMLTFNEDGTLDTAAGGMNLFVQSLIDCGVISGTTAEELQKVVDLTLLTSNNTSESAIANKKLALSQKRLKYNELAKDIKKYTNGKKNLTKAEKAEYEAKKKQLLALASEIDAYGILGEEIEAIKQKYSALETAKETDAERAYGDNLADAMSTMIEGYQSTKLGTEAVEAARNILVPESIYEGAKDTREKLEKEYDYLTKTLGKFMTLEYDDDGVLSSVEVTPDDAYKFLEHMETKGLMNLDDKGNWEFTENASNDLKELAVQAGVTEDVLYALFTSIDEMNANRGLDGNDDSIFDHLTKDAETLLYEAKKELTNAEIKLFETPIGTEDHAQAVNDYSDALLRYSEVSSNARENVEKFRDVQAQYNAKQEEINGLLVEYNNATGGKKQQLADQIKKATEELGEYGTLMSELEVSELTITVAKEQVDADIAEVESKYSDFKDRVSLDESTGKYTVKAGMSFEEGSEDQKELDRYVELLNEQYNLDVMLGDDSVNSLTVLQDISSTLEEIAEVLTGVTGKSWTISVGANIGKKVQDFWDWVTGDKGDVEVSIPETTSKPRTGGKNKTGGGYIREAYANGTDGVKSNVHNALVGELGREMVVNPNTGEYYTVGDNGAEMVDLPRNAIVFNHKQTEELLKSGHISSRGKALVNGNAYAGETSAFWSSQVNGYVHAAQAVAKASGGLVEAAGKIDHAAEDLGDEFKEIVDWFEILVEEIDHKISVYEAKLDNAVGVNEKSGIYAGLATFEYQKLSAAKGGKNLYQDEANKYLSQIDDKYKELAKNGAISIKEFVGEANEAQVEAINNYRDAISKAHEQELQEQESINRIAELRVEKLQMISDEYDNQTISVEHQNSRVQAHIDLLEEQGERISENHYKQMIAYTEEIIELKKAKKAAMELELSKALASGDVEKGSSAYYEMVGAINDVDLEIIGLTKDIESFNNSIRDLHWENFDRIVDAVSNLADESANLRELLGDDSDMVDEFGEWTAEGVTYLGLLAQEMENAEYRAKLFADEIEWLNENWEKEGYSVDEYNEKLQELKDGQYDAIKSYEDAKDAIIDLNKTRIDAIKDGIQKEIDAYGELIEKQKESLQAKKDERDWANTVKDHTDEIASIQRQIDALAGDNSASANAKRKQLEEELLAAEEELNEAYYDREIEMQQEALDKELELYTENKEQEIEGWEKYLEDEQKVLNDSFNAVSANSKLIHQTLQSVADTYGLTISDSITKPWKNGQTAIAEYSTKFDGATSAYMTQLNGIRDKLLELQRIADITADALAFDVKPNYDDDFGKYEEPKKDTGGAAPAPSAPKTYTVKQNDNLWNIAAAVLGDANRWKEIYNANKDIISNPDLIYAGQQLKIPGTSSGGNGSGGSSSGSGSSTSNKTYTSTGGTYTVTSTKGVSFIQSASTGDKMTGGDGSTWVKNANGTVTVTTKDGKKHNISAHAKGTTGVKSDELAWIDEHGLEEIVMHAQGGKLAYLTKGSAVIPHDISENLMELGKVDPKTWMDKNRPTTVPQSFVAQNNNFDLKFGSLINIEHADKDSIPEIQAAVQKQLDSYMKNLNAGIKRYAR